MFRNHSGHTHLRPVSRYVKEGEQAELPRSSIARVYQRPKRSLPLSMFYARTGFAFERESDLFVIRSADGIGEPQDEGDK